VQTSTGELLTADHVIVTVSLGVLKERHATLFNPELSALKQLAIQVNLRSSAILSF
jgi:hypothetical protein